MEKVIAGVDLGGTFIKFGVFGTKGELLDKWQIPTEEKDSEAVFASIAKQISSYADSRGYQKEQIAGIGIGVPGSVNREGLLVSAPNLGWSNLDVGQIFKSYTSVPVFLGNDANVAALGEQYFGVGAGCDSMVLLTLGTGVGGGVVVNQRLVHGCFGGGGEIGHMIVNDRESVACTCGRCGCLEQYVSATGIARLAKNTLEETDKASVLREYEKLTAKEVFDAVKVGDEIALQVAEQFGECLGKALSLIACVVDPQMFVIGGGVSAAGDVLIAYIEKYYRQYAYVTSKQTSIRLASLGNDAGIYGAVRMVMLEM